MVRYEIPSAEWAGKEVTIGARTVGARTARTAAGRTS